MNYLEILVQDIIITLILFPIVIRVNAICKKKRFFQIGPTCGFYALIYAISKIRDIDPKKEVNKLVRECISVGDSCVGEIFDLNLFVSIGERYYPDIEISIRTFKNVKDLDVLLKDYYLIYPILSGKTPHYYLIDGENEKKYFFYSTDFSKRKSMNKETMFNKNQRLEKCRVYKWSQYFNPLIILRPIRWLQWSVWDKELYEFISANDYKKIEWSSKETSIDMTGKVVVVKKL